MTQINKSCIFCIFKRQQFKKSSHMKKSFLLLSAFIFLVFISCENQTKKESTDDPVITEIDFEKEKAKISEILDLLASATEEGNMEMVENIWCPKEDVILIGTESHEKLMGWTAIKNAMSGQFKSFNETLISISDQNIWLDSDAQTAWFFEEMNYNFIYNDKALSIDGIRFTGVFIKTDKGGWKLVQGHVSLPTSVDIMQ